MIMRLRGKAQSAGPEPSGLNAQCTFNQGLAAVSSTQASMACARLVAHSALRTRRQAHPVPVPAA